MANNFNHTEHGDIINQENFSGIGIIKNNGKNNNYNEAIKVKQLIEQLSKYHPTETISQKAVVVEKAIQQIETNPVWKRKVINAVKAGSLAAFEKTIDNPFGAFFVEGIKGWQEIE